jgi:UDP-N-acetylglucosamine--N-acetylmuramyl-(pentapeptide) pyrophosphoryl-undecaprenol N-acetylglucosamine transferase
VTQASAAPLVLLAAGGTGGHLFPAEALATALQKRGAIIDLATDARAVHFQFPARAIHLIPSATLRGSNPLSLARTAMMLTLGTGKAWGLIGRIRPSVVVGFGGYPTVPPVMAASLRGVPTVLHEQNGVMGRANRLLASRVTAIATGFSSLARLDARLRAKTVFTGNPVRPQVVAAAATPFVAPEKSAPFRLVVFGGSQGAHVMAEIVPPAIERLSSVLRAQLSIVQQARAEDLDAVRRTYARIGVAAECAPFFADLPARVAAAHLVVSRSGASTVAELSTIGRPAILVPLPHALDQDQMANAAVLEAAGGAIRIEQRDFTPERLAAEVSALAGDPARLSRMAQGAKSAGTVDAAERLADLVMEVAGA